MTILRIDHSASTREVLRLGLEAEGYAVLEAPDGREGVRLYREHRPALVIADIVMPEKDGIETVRGDPRDRSGNPLNRAGGQSGDVLFHDP